MNKTESLSKDTIRIVKNSAQQITQHCEEITLTMYPILFEKYPQLKKQFAKAPDNQHMKLAEAISAYAINIERLDRLAPALMVIAKRHVQTNVRPSQYIYVEDALLSAMCIVLKEEKNSELMTAWSEAYWYIAEVLINMERTLCMEKSKKNVTKCEHYKDSISDLKNANQALS